MEDLYEYAKFLGGIPVSEKEKGASKRMVREAAENERQLMMQLSLNQQELDVLWAKDPERYAPYMSMKLNQLNKLTT